MSDTTGGEVKALPLGGGVPVSLVSGLVLPDHIAVTQSAIYWSTQTEVESVPLSGGTPTVLASAQVATIHGLAIDGTHVYWTDGAASVLRVPLGGGNVQTVACEQNVPFGIAVDGNYVSWAAYGGNNPDGAILRTLK